ncbi:Replication-associated protein [Plant associated genomovirus 22]|uniref:Replication-associated protein n=1 Tax=Plant associated genomovirus 22 TaxID=2584394 RepID=A0A4Y5QCP0_9VIRU|nr:Replication-associated protein [Plant associated genomovirus 22]QCX29517.1 Replication-associated protein [Plant associated genomovirus 22]
MPFHVNARYFLVTYSHVETLDAFAIVEHFGDLGAEILVSREAYADGIGIHYHVFADFGRKFCSRRADIFDVHGFHPNINPSRRDTWTAYDYVIKDGDVVAGGAERPSGVFSMSGETRWNIIIAADTRDEFFDLCKELDPQRLVCNWASINKYADWRYRVDPQPYVTPNGIFDIANYGDLSEWWDRNFIESVAGRKSLVLYGPTRTGKTTWARSLGDHLYFGGLFSAAELANGGARYAIFDDIAGGIKFFPRWKDWLGCQAQFQVKQMYKDPYLFTWGRPSIWVSNTDPRQELSSEDIDWMEGNCVFVNVTTTIFHANTD